MRREKDVGKIFLTTDGFFNEKPHIKKPRRVAVVQQRKDDGAVGVVKIYSKGDKDGTAYIKKLILSPKEHVSLTTDSIVGSKVILGLKNKNGTYISIQTRDMRDTNDKLKKSELRKVQRGVHNDTRQHRKTYKTKIKKWRKHFK